MKKATVAAMLFLAIGWSVSPTNAFVPNGFLRVCTKAVGCFRDKMVNDKDMITHMDMTKMAILQIADEVLKANTNPRDRQSSQRLSALTSLDEVSLITAYYGRNDDRKNQIFKNAVKNTLRATAAVDFHSSGENKLAAAHFDAEQFENGQNRLIALRRSVVSSIQAGDYDAARRDSGRMFHTLQDFYSHSNWIENKNPAPNPVLGQPGQRIENVASPEQQTCTDCGGIFFYDCYNNIMKSVKDNGILTSGYVGGTKDENGDQIEKPNGKCSHGGLRITDPEQNLPARGGINKDSPYQMISPHYYLHFEAATVAQQATIDMLRNLRSDVNNDQKFGEYLGVFESQTSAEKSAGSLMRLHNRNAILQRHWNRIKGILNNNYIIIEPKCIIVKPKVYSQEKLHHVICT